MLRLGQRNRKELEDDGLLLQRHFSVGVVPGPAAAATSIVFLNEGRSCRQLMIPERQQKKKNERAFWEYGEEEGLTGLHKYGKISSFIDYNMWDDTRLAALRLSIGGFGQLQSMWDVTCDHFFFLPIVGLRSTRSPLNFALSCRY